MATTIISSIRVKPACFFMINILIASVDQAERQGGVIWPIVAILSGPVLFQYAPGFNSLKGKMWVSGGHVPSSFSERLPAASCWY